MLKSNLFVILKRGSFAGDKTKRFLCRAQVHGKTARREENVVKIRKITVQSAQ